MMKSLTIDLPDARFSACCSFISLPWLIAAPGCSPLSARLICVCKGEMLFYSPWFETKKQRGAAQCTLNAAGERLKTPNSIVVDDSKPLISLAPAQMTAWQIAATNLPPNAATATLDNLLIVSFRSDGQWTTRIYDRAHLPPQLARMY